jgi:sugar phosphate isomerase/epimerase
MHLSTHNWMRAEPLETTLARIRAYGYESIEISGEPERYDVNETRRLLKTHGIRCWGAVTMTLGERNLAAKDEAQRARSVDYVKRVVRFVSELDGTEITIVPTTVGKVSPDASPQVEWDWVVEALCEIYDLAEQRGVRMALEPLNRFETYFLNRAEQAVALAEAVGPNCGVCMDAFHMNIEEDDFLQSIRTAGPRLADFHVADNNRLAAGMGTIDWAATIETLRQVGYDGALTVEFVAPVDRTPVTRYPDQVETEPLDISPEHLKFIEDHGSAPLSEEFFAMLAKTSADTILPLIR